MKQSGGDAVLVGSTAGSQLVGCVHAMTLEDAQASTSTIRGMIHIENVSAHTLFDTGAIHSFVSLEFADHLDRVPERTSTPFVVSGPSGKNFAHV